MPEDYMEVRRRGGFARKQYHVAKKCVNDVCEIPETIPSKDSRSNLRAALVRVNIARPVCSLVFGKHHSTWHRLLAGAVVAISGVLIAKAVGHHHNEFIALGGDVVGYGLHGMGLIPFIESLTEITEDVV